MTKHSDEDIAAAKDFLAEDMNCCGMARAMDLHEDIEDSVFAAIPRAAFKAYGVRLVTATTAPYETALIAKLEKFGWERSIEFKNPKYPQRRGNVIFWSHVTERKRGERWTY